MAISIRCSSCRSDHKLGSKSCQHCGTSLLKLRSYKVRVKLPTGRWKSQVTESLELAQKIESKFKIQAIEDNVFDIKKAPLLSNAWEKYETWARTNKKTWKDDLLNWENHIRPYIGNLKMDKITLRNIEETLDKIRVKQTKHGKPYSPASIKHVFIVINHLYSWSIHRELYQGQNPCLRLKLPKNDNRVSNPLTRDNLKKLMDTLDTWENQRAVQVVKFALYSGRRRGEILQLRWKDIDLENGFVTFQGSTTKNSETQRIPLNMSCKEVLRACKEENSSEYVFVSNLGTPYTPNGFKAIWERIRKEARLSQRFHDLRHTFASYLASSGKVDIYTLKELLGHKDIGMTQRYAHLINGALQRGSSVADEVFRCEEH